MLTKISVKSEQYMPNHLSRPWEQPSAAAQMRNASLLTERFPTRLTSTANCVTEWTCCSTRMIKAEPKEMKIFHRNTKLRRPLMHSKNKASTLMVILIMVMMTKRQKELNRRSL